VISAARIKAIPILRPVISMAIPVSVIIPAPIISPTEDARRSPLPRTRLNVTGTPELFSFVSINVLFICEIKST